MMKNYIRKTDRVYSVRTGRPSSYRPEFCDDIIEHMSQGNSLTSWCAMHNTWREVAYEWMRTYPDFSDAYKIAKQKFQEADEKKYLLKMEDPNFKHPGMLTHWMKVKHKDWRDQQFINSTNKNLNINAQVEIGKVKGLSDEIELRDF